MVLEGKVAVVTGASRGIAFGSGRVAGRSIGAGGGLGLVMPGPGTN